MTQIAYPYSAGQRHSPASAELKFGAPFNQVMVGWKGVDYSWKLEPEIVRGNHPDPIGETLGIASYEGSLEVYLAEFYQQLVAIAGPGFAVVKFPLIVTYSENGFDTVVDQLLGCRIKGADVSMGNDAAALTRKVPLYITKILPNGVDFLKTPLVGVSV